MKPTLRRDEVLRYLGYADQQMTPELEERVDGIIERCEKEQTPQGYWETHEVHATTGPQGGPAFAVEDTSLVFEGTDIVGYLQGAVQCALMAVTLGMASERGIKRLAATDPLDALVYQAACSEMVERGADQIEAQVIAYAHDLGLYTDYRYSPGYGDFDLSIQPAFLAVLQAQKRLGIVATDSNMLIPAKSITAVVGMYPKRPKNFKTGCGACNCREWCVIRASGNRCYSRNRCDGADEAPAQEREGGTR